jgi:protein associated with RNAse G/E
MSYKIAKMESFKYPKAIRYFYPCLVVKDEPHELQLYHTSGSPLWNGKKNRLERFAEPGIQLLFPDKDYNISVWWNIDQSFSAYYVNIALPMEWDGETCRFIDLDVDVLWITPASKREGHRIQEVGIHILDMDEFEENKAKNVYATEMITRVEVALDEVLGLIEQKIYPFDDSLINWKPDPISVQALVNLPDSAALWHMGTLNDQ